MSSLLSSPREIEEVIARRFGERSNDKGEPFTVEFLEPFIDKMREFDREKREEEERELEQGRQALAKKRKPRSECSHCGNFDEDYFERDERMAQVTCTRCSVVAAERLVYDGEWARSFEGEVNPSQHGPPSDMKFSSSHNLQTAIAEMPGTRQETRDLVQAQKAVNMMNTTGKKHETRIGFKDDDKEMVFGKMREIDESLQLPGSILDRAETIFAKYRDAVEHLNGRYQVAAACLILAFRERLMEESEASIQHSSSATAAAAQSVSSSFREFHCKYCDFPFSVQRDKIFHQNKCDRRPEDVPNGECSSRISDNNQTADDRSKRAKMA